MTTQTKLLTFSTQSTNASYSNQMNNKTEHKKEEDCQCEMEESSVPSFQSNFARQLHKNEVMSRIPPLATDNKTHQQTGIEINEPRQQIDFSQRNVL